MNTLRLQLFAVQCLVFSTGISAQHTFSIVAVDHNTGEVGSAGATCLDVIREGASALIISDVIPGRGAIHTQSYWLPQNQYNANLKFKEGLSPQELLRWITRNDFEGDSTRRQYGVVDFGPGGVPRSAAFTGANCLQKRGHIVGPNYAIQGNILLNLTVLDSMENCFLNAQGSLASKLIAAMQCAKIRGADARCFQNNVSSRSAFIRVAKPNDSPDNFFLDLEVPASRANFDPIDSLQILFNQWKQTVGTNSQKEEELKISFAVSTGNISVFIQNLENSGEELQLTLFNLTGQKVEMVKINQDFTTVFTDRLGRGIYFVAIIDEEGRRLISRKLAIF